MKRSGAAALAGAVLVCAVLGSLAQGAVIYVNASATGANTGASWADAYASLQSGLDAAVSGDEIWVAAGTYKPTKKVDGTTERHCAFQLKNGVGVYGGFNGAETGREQRDWETNPTILSGDLNGDDTDNIFYDEPTRQDNCFHVFYHNDPNILIDNTAILDGFVVTGGNANYYDVIHIYYGGGMYNYKSSNPTIRNCTFRGNSARLRGGGIYNLLSSTAVITNCVFMDNLSDYGGGMCNEASNPLVVNCIFNNNTALQKGGGMSNIGSSPTITHCIFNNNKSTITGGGINNNSSASPIITNCIFINNSSKYGGGIENSFYSKPTMVNCTLSGNSASSRGGGVDNIVDACPTIINCILWGNSAASCSQISDNLGSAIPIVSYCDVQGGWTGEGNISLDPLFNNPTNGDFHLQVNSPCIDAGNNEAVPGGMVDLDGFPRMTDGHGDGVATVDMGAYEYGYWYDPSVVAAPYFFPWGGSYDSKQTVTITCVTTGATIHYTTNGTDPTESDPVITSGDNIMVDRSLTLKAKAWKGAMTPSAAQSATYMLAPATPTFSKSGGAYDTEQTVVISCATAGATIHYTTNGVDPTESDPEVASGDSIIVDHSMTLKARAWKDGIDPSAVRSAIYTLIAATPVFTPDGGIYSEDQAVTVTCLTPGVTIYYTTDGSDPTVNSLWVENGGTISVTVDPTTVLKAIAYKGNLQPSSVKQAVYRLAGVIYVNAAATGANTGASWADAYTHLQSGLDAADPNSPAEIWVAAGTYKPTKEVGGTGPRYRAFQLKNGVGVYGGFNGTESRRDQRDWEANPTILSGDLNGNDNDHIASDEPTRQDNCYHVFYHNEVNALDGTAILDGFVITSGNGPGFDGGGMYNISSSPTVTHCLFRNNSADYGGGMYNKSSKPKVTDCIFTNNQGGGMLNVSSSPTVTDCLFSNNSAKYGGGMYNYVSSYPTVTHCLFNNNLADDDGGGMSNERTSSPKVTDCIFSNNSAKRGGGMYIYSSNQSVTRCLFSNNSAEYGGGGIYFWDKYQYTSLTVTNCLFINNSTEYGGGGISGTGQITSIINCTFTGNSAVYDGGGIRSSNLQAVNSIFWGNNARTGPQLDGYCKVTYSNIQGGWAGEGGGNIDADPLFVDAANGDFRLQASSPCIDKGSNAAIPAGVAADMDGTPRIVDGNCDGNAVVDMGAYEYFLIGDLNSNCVVDMNDLDIFAGQWQRDDCTSPANCGQADIDRNGVVEWEDFVQFAEQWLQSENIVPPPPPLPSPIAWWKMDETEGTLISDSIGGYHGQTVNSTGNPWVAGHSGNALLLDGVDDYVTLPAGILNPAQTPFSVFAWVRLDAKATNYQAIVQQVDDAGGIGRTWLLRDKSDYLQSSIGGSGTQSNQAVFSTLNQWHHVGLTYNGQTVTLYIDGFSAGSASQTAEGCTGPLLIGRHKTDETTYWNGAIDDVRIYDVVLTPQQVSQLARE